MKMIWPIVTVGVFLMGLSAASGAAIEPNDPSISANLVGWYRSSAGVEKDTGVPAGDGETVRYWRDQSGKGNHCYQDTLSRRPVLVHNVTHNGGKALRFDRVNQNGLWFPQGGAAIVVTNMTMFVVHRPKSISDAQHAHLISTTSFSPWSRFRMYNTTLTLEWYNVTQSGNYLTSNAFQTSVAWFSDPDDLMGIQNVTMQDPPVIQQSTKANTNSPAISIYIMAARNWQEFFDGYIAEAIIYNTRLTQTQIDGIVEYLHNTYYVVPPSGTMMNIR